MFGKHNWLLSIIFLTILFSPGYCLSHVTLEGDQFAAYFDISMEFAQKDPFNKKENGVVKLCRSLYEENHWRKLEPQKNTIIPKIVHLIWLGPSNPPAVFNDCLESVKKYLPDWQIKMWTDKDVFSLHLFNKKYFDEEVNYAAKSDILRYEVLYQFGGVYLDVDMVLIKSLDILNHTYQFYTGLEASDNEAILGNAIIASVPGHPILKECIDMIPRHRSGDLLDWKVVHRTGPHLFAQSFFTVTRQYTYRVIALPKSFFYPISFQERTSDERVKQASIKDETFCVHHWASSWVTYEEKKQGSAPVAEMVP